MTADQVAELLAGALHAPDVGSYAERDGTSVYLYVKDGSILRVDVKPVVVRA